MELGGGVSAHGSLGNNIVIHLLCCYIQTPMGLTCLYSRMSFILFFFTVSSSGAGAKLLLIIYQVLCELSNHHLVKFYKN